MLVTAYTTLKQKIAPFSKDIFYDLMIYAIAHQLYQVLTTLF
ncbi:hypothetical protein IGI42_003504 [Enterococcus sp. AZ109]